ADYVGMASFTYVVSDGCGGFSTATASVDLAAVNDAPRPRGETIQMDEDTPLRLGQARLLENDHDVDNSWQELRIVGVGNATHGEVSLDERGRIHFTPQADYYGIATFTYTVSDGAGGFSVATATLEIAPVNDAPRLTGERIAV